MKKYLVTEAEIVKALWAPGELRGIELPPGAVVLTREQVEDLLELEQACSMDSGFRRILKKKMDELFNGAEEILND